MTAMGEKNLRKEHEDVSLTEVAEISVGVSLKSIVVSFNRTDNKH
jgi:hypothetical protein